MDDRPPMSNDEADANTTGNDENENNDDKNSGSSTTTDDDDNKNDDDENNHNGEDNDTDKAGKDEDDDGECLASLMAAPLPRRNKPHSYSQQLAPTVSHHEIISKRNTRKHSLDEIQISRNLAADYDSSSDDERSRIASVITDGPEFMSQFLERGESDASDEEGSSRGGDRPMRILPEFVGAGGGSGMFKVPVRAAMHPARPPALELRPHPLRETQVGAFLRMIVSTDHQIWAGTESGLRFWCFSDMFKRFGGKSGTRGDEETAPYHESAHTSPTLCMIADVRNRLIWSGHRDGKIRSWKMEQNLDGSHFREGLTWHAHRGPVLSITITSYGDLWSGSENGVIRVWPWECVEKFLTLVIEERQMAALLVERSYMDLKNQVTVGGVCSIPIIDVKYLLSDNCRGKVWSGGHVSFALWDARSKELLKVFGSDGRVDERGDLSSMQEPPPEEEVKVKSVSTSKKDKTPSSMSFFQRSRHALMGAADAVRRVAQKGTFAEEKLRTEALIVSADGVIWSGCSNGTILQWDGNGTRLRDFHHISSSVQCFCTHGTRLWVGYVNGTIQILDLDGSPIGSWVAHSSPVIRMVVGAGYIFTLANHGGIRGWSISSPGPMDSILRTELANKEALYTKRENLKILVGTWNVGQGRTLTESLKLWLASESSDVGIVVAGFQEVEMGAGFLAMAAAKESVGLEGSANGQWWLDAIGRALDEGTTFERVGSRQLAGLLISAWCVTAHHRELGKILKPLSNINLARKNLRQFIGDVDAAAVPCGFGRAIGNKFILLTFEGEMLMLHCETKVDLNCDRLLSSASLFLGLLGAVGLRLRVYDRMICFVNCHFAAHLEAVNRRNADFEHVYKTLVFSRPSVGLIPASGGSSSVQLLRAANLQPVGLHSEDGRTELADADMVVFLGDFNYRLFGISYDEARDFVSQRCFDWLRERDQLRAEMKAGKVFQGLREGIIKFPPTYKFERHQPGLGGYDSGEKKRIPAWCDRILYRDNRSGQVSEVSLDCPVLASILQYEACMEVTDSDHKPVRCIFNVDIAHVDESIRRQEFGEVSPATGVIKPAQMAEVSLFHPEYKTLEDIMDGQSWLSDDTKEREAVLLVKITANFSTETSIHRVQVRHCFTARHARSDSKVGTKRALQTCLQHRSELRNLPVSSDSADDSRNQPSQPMKGGKELAMAMVAKCRNPVPWDLSSDGTLCASHYPTVNTSFHQATKICWAKSLSVHVFVMQIL
ncbi:hypothetical protein ACLOJK_017185 [Asimina triloba]